MEVLILQLVCKLLRLGTMSEAIYSLQRIQHGTSLVRPGTSQPVDQA
jgi:hypothetical protein